MPKIIITTCGTSLYNSSCWTWGNLNEKPLSGTTDRIEMRKRQIQCEESIINAKKQDYSGEELAGTFDINSWNKPEKLRDLPAELASLNSIKKYLGKIEQQLESHDKVVLLHSESSNTDIDGKFCADVLKKVIIKNNLLAPISNSNIETKEIKNLDPANREKFSNALLKVWNYAKNIKEYEVILNLTGGYKALAILLGAFGRQSQGIPIFYLHEEARYDQIFMMKFNNDRIAFTFYDAINDEIHYHQEGLGGP